MSVNKSTLARLLGLILLVSCFFSAIGVVYVTHLNRLAFNRLQMELTRKNETQEEWGQLLLQLSSLTAHSRIERMAMEKLHMEIPTKSAVILGGYD